MMHLQELINGNFNDKYCFLDITAPFILTITSFEARRKLHAGIESNESNK